MNGRPLWERMMIGQWHERSTEKRRKFYWPRGLGGKRPKGQAADGIIRRGFRRAESAFLRTFAARTKGRAIIVLSGPSCNWPIGQRNLWKQQSTEANIFFSLLRRKIAASNGGKNKKIRQASLSNKCGALANSMGRSSAPSSGSG